MRPFIGIIVLAGAGACLVSPNTVQAESVNTEVVNPEALYDPTPNGYSHAVVATGGSRIAHIAGQGGENAKGVLPDSFAAQVKQAYNNLERVLQSLDATPQQVIKINTYVVDYHPAMLDVMTQQVKATFGDSLPAQTLVPVPRLALDGMLFEVDAKVVLE